MPPFSPAHLRLQRFTMQSLPIIGIALDPRKMALKQGYLGSMSAQECEVLSLHLYHVGQFVPMSDSASFTPYCWSFPLEVQIQTQTVDKGEDYSIDALLALTTEVN